MAYGPRVPYIVEQAIATNSTTQKHKLGEVVQAYDSTYGQGEFIYLKGVASTTVGSVVEYTTTWASALSTVALTTPHPLAVAMSACVASEFGWYQISGESIMVKTATVSFAANAAVGTAAGLAIAIVTGLVVNGACVAVVASAATGVTTVRVMINRPSAPAHPDVT